MTISLILFDWGNTVMRVNPQYSGPMNTWPAVETIPGIRGVLQQLQKSFRLAIASNALDSAEQSVRQALARVGLNEYFLWVFSAKEFGVRKPEKEYFQLILDRTASAPSTVLMVGDDYQLDILGAKSAGLKACWFNEGWNQHPPLLPIQDAEISEMTSLPGLLTRPLLPDIQQCLTWMEKEGTTQSLLQHVFTVAQCAYQMAQMFRDRGEVVDPLLVHRGGLLHDLDKLSRHQYHLPHSDRSTEFLESEGYPDLAQIAHRHVVFTLLQEERQPRTLEEKLVYYADKISEGGRVVKLSQRIEGLILRHPKYAEETRAAERAALALEQELCANLSLTADELQQKLSDGVERAAPLWLDTLKQHPILVREE